MATLRQTHKEMTIVSLSAHPIEQTLTKLASLHEYGRGWLFTQTDSNADWLSVAELATESSHLKEIVGRVASKYKSDGLRPSAMLWFGHYVYAIEIVTFACFIIDKRVPDLSSNKVYVRFAEDGDLENIAWQGRSFAALPDDPDASHPDCIVLQTREELREYMHKQLLASLTPIIDSISAYSSMGKPGLWAIAADYSAYSFAALGEMTGDESIGVEESRLFSTAKSRLSVKRSFIPIEHVGMTHYLLDRTSCCLYYKVEGGGYCHSCPHRPLDERIELVKRHMEQEHAEVK